MILGASLVHRIGPLSYITRVGFCTGIEFRDSLGRVLCQAPRSPSQYVGGARTTGSVWYCLSRILSGTKISLVAAMPRSWGCRPEPPSTFGVLDWRNRRYSVCRALYCRAFPPIGVTVTI